MLLQMICDRRNHFKLITLLPHLFHKYGWYNRPSAKMRQRPLLASNLRKKENKYFQNRLGMILSNETWERFPYMGMYYHDTYLGAGGIFLVFLWVLPSLESNFTKIIYISSLSLSRKHKKHMRCCRLV